MRSLIQFGQATHFEIADGSNIVTGVTGSHLADNICLEYSRMIKLNTYLTVGVSASVPGEGLDLAVETDLPVWYGGFVNLVISF